MAHETSPPAGPVLPRRVFLAAALSAVTAGGAVALAYVGGLSRVQSDTFQFSRATAFAAGEEARLRGFLTQALTDDRIEVVIVGHSGNIGDDDANQALSEARAMVAQDMAHAVGVPRARVSAVGAGGAVSLPKDEGEGERAYQSRLARVTVSFQQRK